MLAETGLDLQKGFFGVPRLRCPTSGDYQATGIEYAWHPIAIPGSPRGPARSTGGFRCIDRDRQCHGFHPRYRSKPVKNNSAACNYNLEQAARGAD
jgi:hypothetical protein